MSDKKYLVYFMAGSSGRFLTTILYGLLVDPIRIDYTHNSAHEFQIQHQESTQFHPMPNQAKSWHEYPTEFDPNTGYIIVRLGAADLAEVAANNLHKNLLWNMGRWESGQLDTRPVAYDTFTRLYRRAVGFDWRKSSITELTQGEIQRMHTVMTKWYASDADYPLYADPQVPPGQSHLIINFHDIFTPSSWDSWVALDQIIQYTQVSTVDPQVRDNYQRYVFQRNSDL